MPSWPWCSFSLERKRNLTCLSHCWLLLQTFGSFPTKTYYISGLNQTWQSYYQTFSLTSSILYSLHYTITQNLKQKIYEIKLKKGGKYLYGKIIIIMYWKIYVSYFRNVCKAYVLSFLENFCILALYSCMSYNIRMC